MSELTEINNRMDKLERLVTELAASMPVVDTRQEEKLAEVSTRLDSAITALADMGDGMTKMFKLTESLATKSNGVDLRVAELCLSSKNDVIKAVDSVMNDHVKASKAQLNGRLDVIAGDVASTKSLANDNYHRARALLTNTFDLFGV